MAPDSPARRRPVVLAALVFGLIAAAIGLGAGSAAGQGAPLPYEDPSLRSTQRVNDLLSRMTLEEKVGQMTQTERLQVDADAVADQDAGSSAASSPAAARCRRRTARGLGRHGRPLPARRRMQSRLHIPILYGIDTVHGDGNLLRRDGLPAQHRPRRHARPGARAEIEHIAAEETRAAARSGPSRRASASRATIAGVARTRASASRRASSSAMETAIDGLQGPPGHLDDNDRVLAPAKHYAGDGDTRVRHGQRRLPDRPGDRGHQPPGLLARRPAPVRPGRHEHHVGSVMPSFSSVDWTEDGTGNPIKMHGNRALITRRAQGRPGLRRHRHQRLGGHPPPPAATCHAGARPASTPASTCSWSPTTTRTSSSP